MKKYTKPEINIKKLSAWDIIQTSGLEDMGVGSENGEIVIASVGSATDTMSVFDN